MAYYFSTHIDAANIDEAVQRVTDRLAEEGFGILTTIDVRETMKKKLDEDFRDYRILGACNPPLAHKALQAEDKIGTMLPCNVIVQDAGERGFEVAAIDPAASMQAVENADLQSLASEVGNKLKTIVNAL